MPKRFYLSIFGVLLGLLGCASHEGDIQSDNFAQESPDQTPIETTGPSTSQTVSEPLETPMDCPPPGCAGNVTPIDVYPLGRRDIGLFPPLEYGAPLPLVCTRPYPAIGALKDRPNLQLMWEHYLYEGPRGVWAEVGGAVEYNGCLPIEQGGWRNACTVRLSHMLNKAGHEIPFIKGQTVSGGSGDQYFFRLEDVQTYLLKTFGKPDLDIDDGSGGWEDIPKVPGLLLMRYPGTTFTGHATIWNGAGTVDDADIAGLRILFWALPCSLPLDRVNQKGGADDQNPNLDPE